MRIYRIENKDKKGPYFYGTDCWMGRKVHFMSKKHPSPYQDKLLRNKLRNLPFLQWRFGFKTMKQLKQWFTEKEIKNLKGYGFQIVKLDIPEKHIIVGDKQVMFADPRIISK